MLVQINCSLIFAFFPPKYEYPDNRVVHELRSCYLLCLFGVNIFLLTIFFHVFLFIVTLPYWLISQIFHCFHNILCTFLFNCLPYTTTCMFLPISLKIGNLHMQLLSKALRVLICPVQISSDFLFMLPYCFYLSPW